MNTIVHVFYLAVWIHMNVDLEFLIHSSRLVRANQSDDKAKNGASIAPAYININF